MKGNRIFIIITILGHYGENDGKRTTIYSEP